MNASDTLLLYLIALPAAFALLVVLAPARWKRLQGLVLIGGALGNLVLNCFALSGERAFVRPWLGWGINFSLRQDHFSAFILFSAAVLALLVLVYSAAFAKGKPYTRLLYAGMLFTLALVNGSVLANDLVVMLFFWEGILLTMFVMIQAGGPKAYRTSVKAVVIAGLTDLCMMLGIGLTAYLAGTTSMDSIHLAPTSGWAMAAFALLMVGAVSKAGSMPFHTWIPDAAKDAPTPFLPFLPGALEKLLGIYLLVRLTVDLFPVTPHSAMSATLMVLGAATILFAVMMALIQRDFKRLLSYHAVSQVGYMILGIGTALPIGIVGGLFHMLNNAVYKCGLFLVAGAVEKETGTTDLNKLGGLGKKMPLTMISFIIAAAAIAGFPMTNGFFSKEMVFDAALERNVIFYIIAAVGAFFTPISFLKLGHAVFFGKPAEATRDAKEPPLPMLIPMLLLSAACLALGFGNGWVTEHLLIPILGQHGEGSHVGGHTNWMLVGISAGTLLLGVLDHWRGFKKTGRGVEAADHFHHAPGLRQIYDLAEKRVFDPYPHAGAVIRAYAIASLWINDAISWFYDVLVVRCVGAMSALVRWAHNGSQARYVWWALVGLAATVAMYLMY